jgi:hypothetical protein
MKTNSMFVSGIFKYNLYFFDAISQIIENYCSLTVNYLSLLMNFFRTMTSEQGIAVCPVSKH